MRAVLEEIGFAGAVLAREDESGNLVLIDGHLRAGTATESQIPVLVLDVTEAEADKILATFDPLAGMAEMDSAAWSALINGMDFQVPEFGKLLADLNPRRVSAGLTDEDAVPEPPNVPVSRPGDLWQLGAHRLRCGDATSAENVTRLLDGVQPGLMVTDPPYGVNYDPTWRDNAGGIFGDGKTVMRGKVANDSRIDWSEAFGCFTGNVSYVWHAGRHASEVQRSIESCGFEIKSQIIWAKQHFALSRGDYHWQHEPCWYAVRKGATTHWTGDRTQSTLWQIANLNPAGKNQNEKVKTGHGTQKPVECMRRPILNHANPGQSVYDPFVGSGTTIIAAESTGRVCYALEIDLVYVDVAVKRWEDFTGKKAVRDGG